MGTGMKLILEFLVPVLIALMILTQIVLPMFITGLPFFWLFRKGGQKYMRTSEPEEAEPKKAEKKEPSDLDKATSDLTDELAQDAAKYKGTATKVDETINKLNDAKNNSLNNLNDKN